MTAKQFVDWLGQCGCRSRWLFGTDRVGMVTTLWHVGLRMTDLEGHVVWIVSFGWFAFIGVRSLKGKP